MAAKAKAPETTEAPDQPTNGDTKRARFTVQWAQKVLPNSDTAPMDVPTILLPEEHVSDSAAEKWLRANAEKGFSYKMVRNTAVAFGAKAHTGVELVPA